MFRRLILISLALIAVQCAFSFTATATMPTSCFAITIWYWPDLKPLGWFVWSPFGQGNYSYWIAAMTDACTPPVPEVCPTCPSANKPIALSTGNTYINETDISIPGLGGGLSLSRTWNSTWPASQITNQIGWFGTRWKSNFDEKVFLDSDHFVKYMRSDGSFWAFGLNSNGPGFKVVAPASENAILVGSSSGSSWTLTFQNGEKRLFDGTTGMLTAIIDRNGNTTQISYDSSNRLSTVTDAASRHLYFSYANPASLLVTGVSSDFGVSLSYSYDAQSRLAQVVQPDLNTINFTYNSQSLITSVTDSQGKVLESHTYDSQGRGLTGSQANGVGAVTITYQ